MNRTHSILLSLTLASFALAAPSAHAATLWQVTNYTGSTSGGFQWHSSFVTTTSVAGVTGSTGADMVTNNTIRPNAASATLSAPRFLNNRALDSALTVGSLLFDAVDGGYYQFGIVADSPGTLNLTSLTFGVRRATTNTSTRSFRVDVSVDGAAYSQLAGLTNVAAARGNTNLVTLDLIGTQYTEASSINFRFFASGGALEFENHAINGTLIPEPTTALLGGLGLLALLLRRRR